jgi:hypothetical protein
MSRRTLALALTICLGFCLMPSSAGAGATGQILVSARVDNRCTVRLPARVSDHVRERKDWLSDHLDHRCDLPVRPGVAVERGRLVALAGGRGPVRIERTTVRPNTVLVTITY